MSNMTETPFTVYVDGRELTSGADKDEVLHDAKLYFMDRSFGNPLTVTVLDKQGDLLAWHSNKEITGTFNKQVWGGPKGNDALHAGVETFDATNEVLLMPLEQIQELQDRHDSTDSLGRRLVDWEGPCYVELTADMLVFFGVLDADDITEKHLEFARALHKPEPQEEGVITVTIRVKALKSKGRTWQEVIDELDYSVRSGTVGAVVRDTEVTDANLVWSRTIRG